MQKKWLLFLMVMIFCVGCQFELPTPESLIVSPKTNEDKNNQKQIITGFLMNDESLTVPTGMDNAAAYMSIDIDDDRKEELVAFYRNTEKNFEHGFMILTQDSDDQWHIMQKKTEIGVGIDYFEITDLNNDGRLEVLFGLKSGDLKSLYCYELAEDTLTDLGRIQYESILLTSDDGASRQIVTAVNDVSDMNGGSQINIYDLMGHQFICVYEQVFDGYCKSITYGQISQSQQGFGLAMLHSQFLSVVLLAEEETGYRIILEQPLAFDYNTLQDTEIFSDINQDGILEVCYLIPPEDNNGLHEVDDYLKVWYQWSDPIGLLPMQAIISNKGAGYDFVLPIAWLEGIRYAFRTESGMEWVDFSVENEDFSVTMLFSLLVMDQYSWQQNESLKSANMVVLGNNPVSDKVYLALLQDNLPIEMDITEGRLISCLRINGGK